MKSEVNASKFLVPGVNHCRGCHAAIEWRKTALGKPIAVDAGKHRPDVLIEVKDAPPLVVRGAMIVHESTCARIKALEDAAKAGARLPNGTIVGGSK